MRKILTATALMLAALSMQAQNPFIRDHFTADPSAHVFNGRVYVYSSHDIPAPEDYARKDWFCMADYHVYSSDNLVDWVDHGVIIDQKNVPWVDATTYSMWAPDCNYKNGKYYFYFPAIAKATKDSRGGNSVGVATSDTPFGPFKCEDTPIKGVGGIDPCIFIDDDGTPYLVWSGRGLQMAKLKSNMLELASEPITVQEVPDGFKEGPYLFKRGDWYYFTFPWVEDARETLAYSMSKNPMGPYKFMGKIMEQAENICWTNHHSAVEFKGQWYLFYHHNDYSPYFDKNRSICVDYLNFNPDGTIIPVKPTFRGVGITKATLAIQIDRYSNKSENFVDISFLNSDDPFEGWKAMLWNTTQEKDPRWISYDRVEFTKDLSHAVIKCNTLAGGTIELRSDSVTGPVLATIKIDGHTGWKEQSAVLSEKISGVHDLYVLMTDGSHIDIDWVTFK